MATSEKQLSCTAGGAGINVPTFGKSRSRFSPVRGIHMFRNMGKWIFLIPLFILFTTSCSKKPQDSEVPSKWVILNEGQEITPREIFFVDSLNGWAINRFGGWTNAYYRTRDGGCTWHLEGIPSNPYSSSLYDVAFTDTLNGWLVGGTGVMYHTVDGGQSWTVDDRFYDRPGYPKIKKVFFADSLHGWISVGAFGASQIARTVDAGRNWHIVSESRRRLLQALNKDVAFAEVGWDSRVSRTVDGGETWNEIYPGIENQLSGVEVSFVNKSEGWAAVNWQTEYTYGGFIIATQNAGVTWDTLLVVDNRSLNKIRMLPSREGWVKYGSQGILHTVDGRTWRDDPLPDIGDRPIVGLIVLPGPHAWAVAGHLILKRSRD